MKKEGLAKSIKFLVTFDEPTLAQFQACEAVGVKLYSFNHVIEQGESKQGISPFDKCTARDSPLFSYTSGTTGDSKGVKLTHKNLLSSCVSVVPEMVNIAPEDSYISYLPFPHSFEQVLSFFAIMSGMKVGFYQGDPLKLTEDCALLKPSLFPSVPRLFSRIYTKIKERLDGLTGCKGWLAQKAIATKLNSLRTGPFYTDGCYDKLVFRKVANLLGGEVKYMITASAPIDPSVLEFLKICFCCPMYEGYGLTETSGGSAFTWGNDPVVGHVGGPIPAVKWRTIDVPEMQYLSTDKPYPRGELCM
jgi:long-chain acyl-CoA synthetase